MIDRSLQLDNGRTQTTVATHVSGDTYKLTTVGSAKAEERGAPMEFIVLIENDFASGGAATFEIRVTTGNSAALANPVDHYTTGAIGYAQFKKGDQIRLPFAMTADDADATHIGLRYIIGTAVLTGIPVWDAWIQPAGTEQSKP